MRHHARPVPTSRLPTRLLLVLALLGVVAAATAAEASAGKKQAPVNTSAPAVTGTAEELRTLTATTGKWTANPVPVYAYQWGRCNAFGSACVDVPGAVGASYALAFADVGTTVRVRVTATNAVGTSSTESAPTAVVKPVSLTLPVRAAFYYAWYPENWVPGTHYSPSLGFYSSSDTTVIRKHIAAMQYGGIQAGIYSWWGLSNSGNQATSRFPTYLTAAQGTGFKWAVYYESEGYDNPSAATIEADLKYIKANYATSPNYLRVGGRPVVFVYSGAGDGCDMAARWNAANTIGAYIVLSTSWVDNEPELAAFAPYAGTAALRVAAGDLDGDGKAELVTSSGGAG